MAKRAPGSIHPGMFAPLRRAVRLPIILLLVLLFFLPVWVPFVLGCHRVSGALVRWFFWCLCRVLGLRVQVEGRISPSQPLLMISNHISYLDIFALGSLANVAFTPKVEISRWPVIGYFSRMAGCVFIDRRPRAVDEHRAALDQHLAAGERIVLFAEGTTSSGADILPFRGAFFRMVEWEHARSGKKLAVQPVALAYTHLDGQLLTDASRPQVAWILDAEFAPHWFALMGHRRIDARISFLPEFLPDVSDDRKMLAAKCEADVRATLQRLNSPAQ